MAPASDCPQNADPLKLVREGTSQEQRFSKSLDPAYAPINAHTPAHGIVFAAAYSKRLRYYDSNNSLIGDWNPFFNKDVSAHLAIAGVQDVEYYRQNVKEFSDFLNNRRNQGDAAGLRDRLDYLFSYCATLSARLDQLVKNLPVEVVLKKSLQNLVQSQLVTALNRLIAYHKGGEAISDAEKPLNDIGNEKTAPFVILGEKAVKFSELGAAHLSADWTGGADWTTYYIGIAADNSVYGNLIATNVFDRVNHIATHNLFTSIFDQFLKVYARVVSEASRALDDQFSWDGHEPHYALFLAFLRLFENARAEANTLTGRHLDFYYREILRLKEKHPKPGSVHLLVELAKHIPQHELKAGELFKAGKDDRGIETFFANDRDFVANQTKVAALKTIYRHGDEKVGITAPTDKHQGRLYASPVANSEDGLGEKLTSVDQSWHPFYNKIYQDGILAEIRMPKAEIGFAIASHYLWMAEGTRTITVDFTVGSDLLGLSTDLMDDVTCLLTSEKGWIEKAPSKFTKQPSGVLRLEVALAGADPAATPYVVKTHGYDFPTNLPILLVKLRHRDGFNYIYSQLQDAVIHKIDLKVDVEGLKTLAVSNDFGPVDISKPFLPFGASPIVGSGLIIGSREIFQKNCSLVELTIRWQRKGVPYPIPPATSVTPPSVAATWLTNGIWANPELKDAFTADSVNIKLDNFANIIVEAPDFSENVFYDTSSRNGFLRMTLSRDFGQVAYQTDLRNYLIAQTKTPPSGTAPSPEPTIPIAESFSVRYVATQTIDLTSNSSNAYSKRKARFFHISPFGQAEQHPVLSSVSRVYLLPQFDFQRENTTHESEAEFYIGVTGLNPPENLSLLLQVADGTADPLSTKPDLHIHWSYLRGNEWIVFAENEVEDQTAGVLNSGIITFAMPRDASDANTLLPTGMHWIRAAVASESDAVCRLILVAAQALKATFIDKKNDPGFPAKVLAAGTISKLDQPDASVKKIDQPFASFGGRGAEEPKPFYTRISERLRHKDRAIALWDYERLILEAFPQIYKAKCLNHTHYEPNESGSGVYRELAPGHVTIVTIPNQRFQNLRDPLRPFTRLGLLQEIESFVRKRLSCFVKLHVRNPQFEEVFAEFKVRLSNGFDETFYRTKLQEEITHFLSPWAFPGGGSPSFGGKVYKSVLINFVEERPYVDYVTDFKLFHKYKTLGDNGVEKEVVSSDLTEIEGSKAVSILVSVPAKNHMVQVIKPAEQETPSEKCPCEA